LLEILTHWRLFCASYTGLVAVCNDLEVVSRAKLSAGASAVDL